MLTHKVTQEVKCPFKKELFYNEHLFEYLTTQGAIWLKGDLQTVDVYKDGNLILSYPYTINPFGDASFYWANLGSEVVNLKWLSPTVADFVTAGVYLRDQGITMDILGVMPEIVKAYSMGAQAVTSQGSSFGPSLVRSDKNIVVCNGTTIDTYIYDIEIEMYKVVMAADNEKPFIHQDYSFCLIWALPIDPWIGSYEDARFRKNLRRYHRKFCPKLDYKPVQIEQCYDLIDYWIHDVWEAEGEDFENASKYLKTLYKYYANFPDRSRLYGLFEKGCTDLVAFDIMVKTDAAWLCSETPWYVGKYDHLEPGWVALLKMLEIFEKEKETLPFVIGMTDYDYKRRLIQLEVPAYCIGNGRWENREDADKSLKDSMVHTTRSKKVASGKTILEMLKENDHETNRTTQ